MVQFDQSSYCDIHNRQYPVDNRLVSIFYPRNQTITERRQQTITEKELVLEQEYLTEQEPYQLLRHSDSKGNGDCLPLIG